MKLKRIIQDGNFNAVTIERSNRSPGIFRSRFVEEQKQTGERLSRESRLVAQKYADVGASEVVTKGQTVQTFSQLLMISIADTHLEMTWYDPGITQTYIQSKVPLNSDKYIKPHEELGLPPNKVVMVIKPLFGIPESRWYWYTTYLSQNLNSLETTRSQEDP